MVKINDLKKFTAFLSSFIVKTNNYFFKWPKFDVITPAFFILINSIKQSKLIINLSDQSASEIDIEEDMRKALRKMDFTDDRASKQPKDRYDLIDEQDNEIKFISPTKE